MSVPQANRPRHSCSSIRPAPASGEVVRPAGGCCGKDLGPMEDHEAPSEEDIERFSGVTRSCPQCKEEVYDDAEVCYHCGHAFAAADGRPLPRWIVVGAVLAVGSLLLLMLMR